MLATESTKSEFPKSGFTRSGGEHAAIVPRCPSCGRPMHVARTAPRSSGAAGVSAGLPVFKCGECGVWVADTPDDCRRD